MQTLYRKCSILIYRETIPRGYSNTTLLYYVNKQYTNNIVLYYSIIQSRETIPRHYPNNTQALQYYIISGNNTKTVSKQYTSTTVLYNLGKQYQDIIQTIHKHYSII
jgi:hypothetical protein